MRNSAVIISLNANTSPGTPFERRFPFVAPLINVIRVYELISIKLRHDSARLINLR